MTYYRIPANILYFSAIQCDERCATYSPCVSSCPQETCDNLLLQNPLSKLCKEDSCIEGCAPKPCPPDYVYMNSSLTECVPRNVCKPICLEINSIIYYEGDLMEGDDCHNCFCTRGKKTCKGQPCTTLPTPTAVRYLSLGAKIICCNNRFFRQYQAHKKS